MNNIELKNDKAKLQLDNLKHFVMENEIGIYDGEVNSKYLKHGYGVFKWKKSADIYEGYWQDNLRNGQGEYIHSDGSIYRGEWLNDLKHGKGNNIFIHFNQFISSFYV